MNCDVCVVTVVKFGWCSAASSVDENKATHIVPNEDIVSQLAIMGFNYLHCQKAAINTSNIGVEEAMNWLLAHMDDPGLTSDQSYISLLPYKWLM